MVGTQTHGVKCSATLVHPQLVLSASHCLLSLDAVRAMMDPGAPWFGDRSRMALDTNPADYAIYIGNGAPGGQVTPQARVTKIFPGPKFDPHNWGGQDGSHADLDVAFLLLDKPVEGVDVMPIFSSEEDVETTPSIREALVIGFGEREKPDLSGEKYLARMPFRIDGERDELRRARSEMVIGDPQKHVAPGDSGGPAFVNVVDTSGVGHWKQIGTVSTGPIGSAGDQGPSSFARTYPSLCWINRTLADTGISLPNGDLYRDELDKVPTGATRAYDQGWLDMQKAVQGPPPKIVSMIPKDGDDAVSNDIGELLVTFDRPMYTSEICVHAPCSDGVCHDHASWKDDKTLVIKVEKALTPGKSYDLQLGVNGKCVVAGADASHLPYTPWRFTAAAASL